MNAEMDSLKHDVAIGAAKTAPAVVGAGIFNITLNEWVAVATLAYITIQALILLHKHYYFVKDKSKKSSK